jgi:hypothetical protein
MTEQEIGRYEARAPHGLLLGNNATELYEGSVADAS